MALPFLPAIDARQEDTLAKLLQEKQRQLDLAKQTERIESWPPPLAQRRKKNKRAQHQELSSGVEPRLVAGEKTRSRKDWMSFKLARPKTTTSSHGSVDSSDGSDGSEGSDGDDALSFLTALHLEVPSTKQDQVEPYLPKPLRTRSSDSDLIDRRPRPSHDRSRPNPPTRPRKDSATALPSTVDRIFPQRRMVHPTSQLTNWAFPATEIFRACARMLVTPFGDEFAMDPLQLNAPALFTLPACSQNGQLESGTKIRVLDLGGSAQDEYTRHLADMPNVALAKIVPSRSSSVTLPSDDDNNNNSNFPILCTHTLTRLPLPDSSVDIVSTRSLHKTMIPVDGLESTTTTLAQHVRACLAECYRVLAPGGRLEYIYFGDKLLCCGPLTGDLETFLWEVWTAGDDDNESWGNSGASGSGSSGGGVRPDTDEFLALVEEAGFEEGKHLGMRFGLFTLRTLYDYRGRRRRWVEMDPMGPMEGGIVSDCSSYTEEKARELLLRVHEESCLRNTGWKCVMGYATKRLH